MRWLLYLYRTVRKSRIVKQAEGTLDDVRHHLDMMIEQMSLAQCAVDVAQLAYLSRIHSSPFNA